MLCCPIQGETMSNGYVKLWRGIWENPHMSNSNYLAVWLWILTHAEHGMMKENGQWRRAKDDELRRVLFKGKIIRLKPGQLTCGSEQISLDTGVPPSSIRRHLKVMKSEQQIEQQVSSRFSLITVINWDQYQLFEQQSEQRMSSKRAADEQLMSTIKEDKHSSIRITTPIPPPRFSTEANELFRQWKEYGLPGTETDLLKLASGKVPYDPAMLDVCRLYGESRRLVRFMNDLLKKRGDKPLHTFRDFPARNFYDMFISEPTGNRRFWRHYVGKDVSFVFERDDQADLADFAKSPHAAQFPFLFHAE